MFLYLLFPPVVDSLADTANKWVYLVPLHVYYTLHDCPKYKDYV